MYNLSYLSFKEKLMKYIFLYRIGKILIQTNWDSGEPELYYLRLPKDIKDYKVETKCTGGSRKMCFSPIHCNPSTIHLGATSKKQIVVVLGGAQHIPGGGGGIGPDRNFW